MPKPANSYSQILNSSFIIGGARNYSGGLLSQRQEGVIVEGAAEVFEHWQAVFAQGRDITEDSSVTAGALQGAKTAGNLHSDFHHAEGPFGFVVGKGQSPIPQEGQNAILAARQPIQQVLFFGLLRALFSRLLRSERVGLAASA